MLVVSFFFFFETANIIDEELVQDALKARRETKQYKNSSSKHKLHKQNTQNNQEPKLAAPYNQVTESIKLPKAKKTPPKAITAAQQKHTKG